MNPELPLRDIHAAAAPPWWPPAPGWWVVAALVLLLLIWVGIKAVQRIRIRRHRAALLQELDALVAAHAETDLAYLRAVADFCKRLLLHEGARVDIAVASGETLAEALSGPWADDDRYRTAARSLAVDQYRSTVTGLERDAVHDLARAWVDRVIVEKAA